MLTLTNALAPYMDIEPEELSEATTGTDYIYYYTSTPSNNNQSYGFMVYLDGDGGSNDGRYFSNAYEVGQDPRYCMSNYSGTDANWNWSWNGVDTLRCYGGD